LSLLQELTSLSEESWSAIKHRFSSSSYSLELDELEEKLEEELESLSSSFLFLEKLFPFLLFTLFSIWTVRSYVTCFTTSIAIQIWNKVLVFVFIPFMTTSIFAFHKLCEFLYHETHIHIARVIIFFGNFVFLQYHIWKLCSFSFLGPLLHLNAQVQVHALNLPKRAAMDNVTRFWDSVIVVTFGCHVLFKALRIFIFNSSLSKFLPNPVRWLTLCVNRFCTL